jgi:hypothetical protein
MPTTSMSVDVTINEKGEATYKSSSSGVQEDGTIDIDEGEDATITFEPASGQTWTFVSPWVVIDPTGGDVSFVSGSPTAVVIQDDNPAGPPSTYSYCLQTSQGALDPRLINKGGN